MKIRLISGALFAGAFFAISALASAQDYDPNNPLNWKIQKSWSGWVQRDIFDVSHTYYHDYTTISGVVAKGGYMLSGGTSTGYKTYMVRLFAQCHIWVNWIGLGPAPSSVTLKVGPACHAEVDDAAGNNYNATGAGAGLPYETSFIDSGVVTGPPDGYWMTFDDNVPTGNVCTITLAPGPSGGTYDFSASAYGGTYLSGYVMCSCNMGASFLSSP